MVLDKSYRMNTTQEFQILLRKLSGKTKRCLNSIERSAEEQKTVKEIPYTPFLRVKITVFLAHSGVFLWLEKHDWQLWDMTNWLKHPGEEHYFLSKITYIEHFQRNLRWLRLKSLLCCKRQNSLAFWSQAWNQWATKNPLKSNQKSLVILWYQNALMMEARNSSYTDMKITHSKALYAFNMPGWSYCQKSSEYKAFSNVMHSKCVSPLVQSTQQVWQLLRGTRSF